MSLTDPQFLVHENPTLVTAALNHASLPDEQVAAAVYRASAHIHGQRPAEVRQQLLALDATRFQVPALTEQVHVVETIESTPARWRTAWATGSHVDWRFRFVLPGHAGGAFASATASIAGKPLAISSDRDCAVRIWDLTTRQQTGELTGHTGRVNAVATADLNGRRIAVTGGWDKTLRIWDLATCRQIGDLLRHPAELATVATGRCHGRPVAITGCYYDNTARVWDLTGHEQIAELIAHTQSVVTVATAELDACLVGVTGSWDDSCIVWDLTTGRQIGDPLTRQDGRDVATAEVDGRPVVVTSHAVWDLATRERIAVLPSHDNVDLVAAGSINGHPYAFIACADETVQVWDLVTKTPVGPPLTGHSDYVHTISTAEMDGQPVAIIGTSTGRPWVWDPTLEEPFGNPRTGHSNEVRAVATAVVNGRQVAVTTDHRHVSMWDMAIGERIGKPLDTGFCLPRAMAITAVNNRPVAIIVGGDDSDNNAVWVCDLTHQGQIVKLTGYFASVAAVVTAEIGGRPVAVTSSEDGTLRAWDLTTNKQIGDPLFEYSRDDDVWAMGTAAMPLTLG